MPAPLASLLATYAGLVLLGGRAGDLLGRRPMLVAGAGTGRLALVRGSPRCPAANRQPKSSSQGK